MAENVASRPPPASPDGKEVLVPESRAAWRTWLASNGDRPDGLWVVHPNKASGLEGPLYDELVEEALCFGWIDSRVRRLDGSRRIQWFSPRRRGGIWSAMNKARIASLKERGLMTEAGQKAIDDAVADGSWSQADDAEALVVSPELGAAFDAVPGTRAAFDALPASTRKQHLWSVYSAKREDTRAGRIGALIALLSGNVEADRGTIP
jgi:uncharacterized protein YdeI (YjbR/CyaY-like superfamily)